MSRSNTSHSHANSLSISQTILLACSWCILLYLLLHPIHRFHGRFIHFPDATIPRTMGDRCSNACRATKTNNKSQLRRTPTTNNSPFKWSLFQRKQDRLLYYIIHFHYRKYCQIVYSITINHIISLISNETTRLWHSEGEKIKKKVRANFVSIGSFGNNRWPPLLRHCLRASRLRHFPFPLFLLYLQPREAFLNSHGSHYLFLFL